MLIEIEHALRFEYDDFIHESFMELRVEPLTDSFQTLRSFYLAVGPPTRVSRYTDWQANFVHHFGISDYHDRIEVLVRSVVETQAQPELTILDGEGPAPATGPLLDFVSFGGPVVHSSDLANLSEAIGGGTGASLGQQVTTVGHHLFEQFEYRTHVTDYRSSSEHILRERVGVCQDFAHLMLAVLRLRGIACRYVSGYLHLDDTGNVPAQSHAWVEVHSPAQGWMGFDPTHGRVPDERYVVVARGRHYDDVPPNRGVFRGSANERLHISVMTRTAPPKDVASLQEEIGQLDVPVYRTLPQQPPVQPSPEVPEPAQQQQRREDPPQQQQQQQQQQS